MPAIIHAEPDDADRRLRALGLDRESLIEAVKACVAARSGCTDNDVQSAPGTVAWHATVRRLRELYRTRGWEKANLEGIEGIEHPDLRIRVTYVATDQHTGRPNASPRNRTPKGPAEEKVVDLNSQFDLFGDDTRARTSESYDGYSVWHLCVFDDGNAVRAELSRPIAFRDGRVIAFSERIFLLGPGDWEELDLTSDDDGGHDDLDIDVRRKA